jgi:hypothetical protein
MQQIMTVENFDIKMCDNLPSEINRYIITFLSTPERMDLNSEIELIISGAEYEDRELRARQRKIDAKAGVSYGYEISCNPHRAWNQVMDYVFNKTFHEKYYGDMCLSLHRMSIKDLRIIGNRLGHEPRKTKALLAYDILKRVRRITCRDRKMVLKIMIANERSKTIGKTVFNPEIGFGDIR